MSIAITSRTTSSFGPFQMNHLTNRLNALAEFIEEPFGLVIYDYSHAANRLLKVVDVHPLDDGAYSVDLDRVFPSLAARANRMLIEGRGRRAAGIMPIDLVDGSSLLIVAATDLMIIGFKSDNSESYNHEIIRKILEIIAEVKDGIPTWQPATVTEMQINNLQLALA